MEMEKTLSTDKFLEEPQHLGEFECPICLEVHLSHLVMLKGCGHLFGKSCLERVIFIFITQLSLENLSVELILQTQKVEIPISWVKIVGSDSLFLFQKNDFHPKHMYNFQLKLWEPISSTLNVCSQGKSFMLKIIRQPSIFSKILDLGKIFVFFYCRI
jgi:hypothetical protein